MTSERTLVLGGTGFIGRALTSLMAERGMDFISIGSKDINLGSEGAHEKVSDLASRCSSVVFLSAKAPTKTITDLCRNSMITESVCKGLAQVSTIKHLTLISSDAVYSSRESFVSEATPPAPDSLHGVMNLSREIACSQIGDFKIAIIRPTGVYGPGDTHNSYGPNRFARQITRTSQVDILGKGYGIRDHIYVGDLARLILRAVHGHESGLANAVSGTSISFRDLASLMVEQWGHSVAINFSGDEDRPTSRYYEDAGTCKWSAEIDPIPLAAGVSALLFDKGS